MVLVKITKYFLYFYKISTNLIIDIFLTVIYNKNR